MKSYLQLLVINAALITCLQAQVSIHRFNLNEVSYEYVQASPNTKRCLDWSEIQDRKPTLEYTKEGTLYTKVKIQVRVLGECKITIEPDFRASIYKGDNPSEMVIEFTVLPPISSFIVRSGQTTDRIVIEAPAQRLKEVGFFNFFRNSQTYFDMRYSKFVTNNPSVAASQRNKTLFPVIGGRISIPFPWWPRLQFGAEMYQKLVNYSKGSALGTSYSEAALDARLVFSSGEKQGRPFFALVGNYRGRGVIQDTTTNSLSLNYVSAIGGGVDAASFFPGSWSQSTFLTKLGLETSFRMERSAGSFKSLQYNLGMMYRFNDRWALGVGLHNLKYDFALVSSGTSTIISESMKSYYLRLHLLPLLKGDKL